MYAVKIKGKGNYASDSEQVFDYAINVTNNQKIKTGTATVKIKGIGNWGGTCDVKFKINKVK